MAVFLIVFSVISVVGMWIYAHKHQNQYKRREELVSGIVSDNSNCSVISLKNHHSDIGIGIINTHAETGAPSNKLSVKSTEMLLKATDEAPGISVTQILSNLYSHQNIGSIIVNQPHKLKIYKSKCRLMSLVDKDGFHIDNLAYALNKDVCNVDEESISNEKYSHNFQLMNVFDKDGLYIVKSDYEQNTDISKLYKGSMNFDSYSSRSQPMDLVNKDGFHIDQFGCELNSNISISNEESIDYGEDLSYSGGSSRSDSYCEILKDCSRLEEELNSPIIQRKINGLIINELANELKPGFSETNKASISFENDEICPGGNYRSDSYGDILKDCSQLEEELNSSPSSPRKIIGSLITRETSGRDTNVSFESLPTPLPFDNYMSLVRLDSFPYD